MEPIVICTGRQISRDYIEQALKLDRIVYDDIYQLDIETCMGFHRKNPDIYIMAVEQDTQKVVGYINFSPVNRKLYAALASGKVIDTVVTGEQIPRYRRNRYYRGCFSSIVVHPEYRCQGIGTKMLMCWSDLVCRLAREKNIYFRSIAADAVTGAGESILQEMGFSLLRESGHGSGIMTVDYFSDDIVPSGFNREILRIYHQKKAEESA